MTYYNSIIEYFGAYCHFFHIENQIALIDGRSYDSVLAFQHELERLLFELDKSKLNQIKEISNTYKEELAIDYGTHSYPSCIFADTIEDQVIDSIFDESFKILLKHYYTSYEQLSIFTELDTHDVLLIEFNDMLAHILVALLNKTQVNIFRNNVERAKNHLYRAILDGYKEIIAKEVYRGDSEDYYLPKDIKRDLFKMRMQEIKNIGQKPDEKITLINQYKELVTRIINMPDKDEV